MPNLDYINLCGEGSRRIQAREHGGMPNLKNYLKTLKNKIKTERRERGGMPLLKLRIKFLKTDKTLIASAGTRWYAELALGRAYRTYTQGTSSECLRNTVVCSNPIDDVPMEVSKKLALKKSKVSATLLGLLGPAAS